MRAKLLIESDSHRTRAAVLEDGRPVEVYLELTGEHGVVGNIYRGRVSRILPGMQAAFVDIGLGRDAFLYAGDVRDARLPDLEELEETEGQAAEPPPVRPIEELLERGQELTVQAVKAPLSNKGARITTEITLPGRYVVLLPTDPNLGVSRRIQAADERDRLRQVIEELQHDGCGLIVRTAGEGKRAEDFRGDVAYLTRLWRKVEERVARATSPTLLHQDHDLALRIVRDRLSDDFDQVLIDDVQTYDRVVEFAHEVEPALADRIELFEEHGRLFERFGVDSEIATALGRRVWLSSGGYVVIDPTEALVAIDVNTGRFVGRTSLEQTVLQTNLEAAREIVRQIRLRDLSGLIVIDFIDMIQPANRQRVFETFLEELGKDRARTQALPFSDFGLVELTRKRGRANLQSLLTRECPYCEGTGRIDSISTTCLRLRREALSRRAGLQGRAVRVRVHPEVHAALEGEYDSILPELREALDAEVRVEVDPGLRHDRFELSDG